MPRGAKPGERRGGRKKGGKNKRTIIRESLIAEVAREVGVGPENAPLKKLMDFGRWFESRAAAEQRKSKPNEELVLMCVREAVKCFAAAAPYVHARLSAVMVKQDDTPRDETVQVTLKIGARTERIINREDGTQVTVIEHDEEEGERLPN